MYVICIYNARRNSPFVTLDNDNDNNSDNIYMYIHIYIYTYVCNIYI